MSATHGYLLLLALDQLGLLLNYVRLLDLLHLLKSEALQELLFFPLKSCLRLCNDSLLSTLLVVLVEDLPLLRRSFEPETHISKFEVGTCLWIRILLSLVVVVVDTFVVDEFPIFIFSALPWVFLLPVAVTVGLTVELNLLPLAS